MNNYCTNRLIAIYIYIAIYKHEKTPTRCKPSKKIS